MKYSSFTKRSIAFILAIAMLFSLTACGTSETMDGLIDKASKTAGDIADKASDSYGIASDYVGKQVEKAKNAVHDLSLPDFKQGFETAASFFGTTIASIGGQTYVQQVADAIAQLENNIASRVNSGPIPSNAGNLAEEWHAGTFNIDAVAKDVKTRASTGKSNGLGSSDITLTDNTQVSSKYYKTAQLSAQQQAKNYIERYNEYASGTKNALSMDDWLAANGVNLAADDPALYWSIYKDQVRLIPKDQLKDAIACLEKSVKSNAAKDGANRQYVSDADLETLRNLTDKLKSADGAESIPLSKAEAESIARSAQEGDFTAAEFGITTTAAIKGSYIAKQALKSGTSAAIIQATVELGPQIYEIIKYGIENGELDEEQLKSAGIDGLSAAGDGFLKGSISNALVVMCKSGKLGAAYTEAPPSLIGALTVLIIDAIRYGIMMANGNMTTSAYIDVLAQEVTVSAGSLGAATLVAAFFPSATLAILLGSFVGGLVVSAGYTTGKTYVLALVDSMDIDLLLPVESTAETVKDAKEVISIKVKDAVSDMKTASANVAKKVTIKVVDLKDAISFQ